MERLVVGAVDVHEPLDLVGRERAHLRLQAGAADRLQQLLVGVVAAEHLAGRVPHRGEDDRAGVHDGAVEVEENGLEPHASIVSAPHRPLRPGLRRASAASPRRCQRRRSGVAEVSDFRYLVVPHTHWDREWYLPFEQFRLRLGSVVDGVLDTLERDPSFTSFTLDGQAIVLEDYLEVRPENEGRLQALLDAGRLEVGPSYVLPDEILVGGESLVRNLLLGRRVCRRFGVEPSGAGYLPDSFGHPAQLPQILAGFGIRTFLFSRGMGDEIDDVGVVFRWRAGPAEVVACQMLPHYDNFARLTWYDDAEERVRAIVERFGELLRGAGQDEIVLANGSDHLPVEPELPEILSGARADARRAVPDRPLRRIRARCRRAAGARGRAGGQQAPEHPARGQLGADLPQAGERARRATPALDRDGRRAANAARRCRVPGRRPAAGVARPPAQPPARLDLRLLVRRGAPRHARPLRAARPDARLRRAGGARGRRRAREHAAVPAAPPRRRRALELDGFSGGRPEPFSAARELDRSRGDRRAARLRGRARRRRPLHVLSLGARPTSSSVGRRAGERRGARARARAAGDQDRDDDSRVHGPRPLRADERRRERGGGSPASRPRPLRRAARTRCGPRASSPSSIVRSRRRLRAPTGSSRRCRRRTRSAPSRSGHSSCSRKGYRSTRRRRTGCD